MAIVKTVIPEHGYVVISGNATRIIESLSGLTVEVVLHHERRAEEVNKEYAKRICEDVDYRNKLKEEWRRT